MRRALPAFFAAAALIFVVAASGASGLSRPVAAASQSDPYLNNEGYHKYGVEYAGREELKFNGELQGLDVEVGVDDYGTNPNYVAGDAYRQLTVAALMQGTSRSSMVVADYANLALGGKRLTLEQRAIMDVRSRIDRDQPVNVLVGTLYGLRANSVDIKADRFDAKSLPLMYENAVLYVERHGNTVLTVIVTAQETNQGNWHSYFAGSPSIKPGTGHFFPGAQGAALTTKLPPSRYVSERSNFRVWSARAVRDCNRFALGSRCMYKGYQKDANYLGYQQVVLVTKLGTLQMNKTQDGGSMHREVGTKLAIRLVHGELLSVGNTHPQRLGIKDPKAQLNTLLSNGGTVWGAADLASLPAFSF